MLTEWLGVPSFMTKSMLVARKSPAGLRGDIKSVLVVSSRLQLDTDAALVGVDGVGSGSITDDGGLCIDWAVFDNVRWKASILAPSPARIAANSHHQCHVLATGSSRLLSHRQ